MMYFRDTFVFGKATKKRKEILNTQFTIILTLKEEGRPLRRVGWLSISFVNNTLGCGLCLGF